MAVSAASAQAALLKVLNDVLSGLQDIEQTFGSALIAAQAINSALQVFIASAQKLVDAQAAAAAPPAAPAA